MARCHSYSLSRAWHRQLGWSVPVVHILHFTCFKLKRKKNVNIPTTFYLCNNFITSLAATNLNEGKERQSSNQTNLFTRRQSLSFKFIHSTMADKNESLGGDVAAVVWDADNLSSKHGKQTQTHRSSNKIVSNNKLVRASHATDKLNSCVVAVFRVG